MINNKDSKEIRLRKATAQGDPIAMATCSMGLTPL